MPSVLRIDAPLASDGPAPDDQAGEVPDRRAVAQDGGQDRRRPLAGRDEPHPGVGLEQVPVGETVQGRPLVVGGMDLPQVYDGFSPFVWFWLEVLGLCPPGEAHRFVADGGIDSDRPVHRSCSLPTAGWTASTPTWRLRFFGSGRTTRGCRNVSTTR